MYIYLFFIVIIINIIIISFHYIKKYKNEYPNKSFDLNIMDNLQIDKINKNKAIYLFDDYVKLLTQIRLNKKIKNKFLKFFLKNNIEKYYMKKLNSRKFSNKIEGAYYLGFLNTKKTRLFLEKKLNYESNYLIKTIISFSLYKINDIRSIDKIINTIYKAPYNYQKKIYYIVSLYEEKFFNILDNYINSNQKEIQKLIIYFSSTYFSEKLRNYLILKAKTGTPSIKYYSLKSLYKIYPETLINKDFLYNKDYKTRIYAILSVEKNPSEKNINTIYNFLNDKLLSNIVFYVLKKLCLYDKKYLILISNLYLKEKSLNVKLFLGKILINHIQYIENNMSDYENIFYNLKKQNLLSNNSNKSLINCSQNNVKSTEDDIKSSKNKPFLLYVFIFVFSFFITVSLYSIFNKNQENELINLVFKNNIIFFIMINILFNTLYFISYLIKQYNDKIKNRMLNISLDLNKNNLFEKNYIVFSIKEKSNLNYFINNINELQINNHSVIIEDLKNNVFKDHLVKSFNFEKNCILTNNYFYYDVYTLKDSKNIYYVENSDLYKKLTKNKNIFFIKDSFNRHEIEEKILLDNIQYKKNYIFSIFLFFDKVKKHILPTYSMIILLLMIVYFFYLKSVEQSILLGFISSYFISDFNETKKYIYNLKNIVFYPINKIKEDLNLMISIFRNKENEKIKDEGMI